jgi:D,D-heptose 1,7-bisphosphate phosphatase
MSDKAIFLDRDDTLIHDPGYINDPEQVKLMEGVPECLIGLRKLGYKLVVITNQSAVARGIVTEKVLAQIHERLEELLMAQGVQLDRIYYCPFHPDGVIEKYRQQSDQRKPNPGMLLTAAQDLDIDLTRSWCIGNSPSDVEAGAKAGCKTILVNQMSPVDGFRRDQTKPDHIAVNMRETLNIIKKFTRSAKQTVAMQPPTEAPAPQTEPETPSASPSPPELPKDPPEDLTSAPSEPTPPDLAPSNPTPLDPVPSDPVPAAPQQDLASSTTEQLLQEISSQLRAMQRDDMFDEFSLVRLMAGVTQTAVPFCLLIALWFLLTVPRQYDPIFTALGFATVLQIMSLTLNMHGRN